jgi:hypothetical protein
VTAWADGFGWMLAGHVVTFLVFVAGVPLLGFGLLRRI